MDPFAANAGSALAGAALARRSALASLETVVMGVSDRARDQGIPECAVSTGFFKLPATFISTGDAIVWPKFSQALDCDA